MNRLPLTIGCLGVLAGLLSAGETAAPQAGKLPPAARGVIDFQRDIKPLLRARCFACHGPEKHKAGLRLDNRAAAFEGADSGAVIVAGKSASSRLIQVVAGLDADTRMPPNGKPLTPAEVGRLRAWIDQGAKWPDEKALANPTPVRSRHWAYQPPRRLPPPRVARADWPRNPIDAFVLARLEKEHIAPAPEADRATLIRRVSLDLLGLPPTPEEVDAFVADAQPDAYERLVDRLLASPHYGERWGRHWLDLARYADSDGFEKDTGRPYAWRYRHWVIAALNRDLPFDEFTIEQLAGDLLPNATVEQKVATGFHRNTLTNKEGGVDQEQFRVEQVVDRVNTTAKVFLGTTLGCAQCHDHKYDPFSQREYYQFFAFFNSDREVNIPAPLPREEGLVKKGREEFLAKKAQLQAAIDAAKDDKKRAALRKALAAHETAGVAQTLAQTLALGKTRKTHVLIRGDFLRPGVEVEPGTPAVLPPLKAQGKRTRLDLARWIVDPANPLTGRVITNWVWEHYFGRGLVATPEDFGTQGEKPSHPELLDWLATEFVRQEWRLKALHRLIVTSATYRQSSGDRPELRHRDAHNVLLARQSRLRVEAEIVRDLALASSGLLVPTVGGPSVRPPQPKGISELTYAGSARWVESQGPDRYRRGLYIWFQRTSPFPMLMMFDCPDSNVSAVRRDRTNTPLQALTLMNDTVFLECAQALGRRVMDHKAAGLDERIRYAFRLCLSRPPSPREVSVLRQLYNDLVESCRKHPKEAAGLLGKAKLPGAKVPEAAAWVALARAVMNLDEFVTRE